MERAKRLEFKESQMQENHDVMDAATPPPVDTASVTRGQELAEIIAAWTKLSPEIRAAVLTLIRVSKLDAT